MEGGVQDWAFGVVVWIVGIRELLTTEEQSVQCSMFGQESRIDLLTGMHDPPPRWPKKALTPCASPLRSDPQTRRFAVFYGFSATCPLDPKSCTSETPYPT
jgi:hypothetical protein